MKLKEKLNLMIFLQINQKKKKKQKIYFYQKKMNLQFHKK